MTGYLNRRLAHLVPRGPEFEARQCSGAEKMASLRILCKVDVDCFTMHGLGPSVFSLYRF